MPAMQKIPTLFERNRDGDHLVRDEVVPAAAWVLAGEGVATRKFDGTCVFVGGGDGILSKRYDAKHGKTPPEFWTPAQSAPDLVTGHWPGWIPAKRGNPENRWLWEAYDHEVPAELDAHVGTYELVGPKINGNPEGFADHRLIRHGSVTLADVPRTYDGLVVYLHANRHIEGIVWHHPDGRMAKLKAKDFGWSRTWPAPATPATSNTTATAYTGNEITARIGSIFRGGYGCDLGEHIVFSLLDVEVLTERDEYYRVARSLEKKIDKLLALPSVTRKGTAMLRRDDVVRILTAPMVAADG